DPLLLRRADAGRHPQYPSSPTSGARDPDRTGESHGDTDRNRTREQGMKLAALLAVVALMSLGQILFKLAAARIETVAFTWATAEKLILNPYLVLGVIVYGLTTVLWVLVLVDGSLSRA